MGLFSKSSSKPYKAAAKYLDKIEPMLQEYYSPYVEAGQRAMPTLEEQYAMLMGDPGALYNQLASGFQTTPGYEFQLQQGMNAASQAAAAGGMAGTPAHMQQSMGYAQGLANQQFNDYMSKMLGMYGQGLSGTQGMFSTGYGATNQLAGGLESLYANQANLAMSKEAAKQQQMADLLGGWFGTGAAIGGALMGGPAGGAVGAQAGNAMGQTMAGWL